MPLRRGAAERSSVEARVADTEPHDKAPVQSGLVNLGKTCYVNAIIQGLKASRGFSDALLYRLNSSKVDHNH